MKNQNIHQQLENVARKYLGVPLLRKSFEKESYTLTPLQLEKALKEAYKIGEKLGYESGFNDAKDVCECPAENPVSENVRI